MTFKLEVCLNAPPAFFLPRPFLLKLIIKPAILINILTLFLLLAVMLLPQRTTASNRTLATKAQSTERLRVDLEGLKFPEGKQAGLCLFKHRRLSDQLRCLWEEIVTDRAPPMRDESSDGYAYSHILFDICFQMFFSCSDALQWTRRLSKTAEFAVRWSLKDKEWTCCTVHAGLTECFCFLWWFSVVLQLAFSFRSEPKCEWLLRPWTNSPVPA